jgi:hypothetical protein
MIQIARRGNPFLQSAHLLCLAGQPVVQVTYGAVDDLELVQDEIGQIIVVSFRVLKRPRISCRDLA